MGEGGGGEEEGGGEASSVRSHMQPPGYIVGVEQHIWKQIHTA